MFLYLLLATCFLQSFIIVSKGQSAEEELELNDESVCRPFTNTNNDPCGLANHNGTFYQTNSSQINPDYIKLIQLVTKVQERNTNCSTRIVSLICYYLYPPCTNNGEPRPLCIQKCNQITQDYCQREWSHLREIARESNLLRPLVHGMDCQHSYHTGISYTNMSQCVNVSTNIQVASSSLDIDQFAIIFSLIFVFEVALLLVSIGLTVICVRKLRRWKKTTEDKEALVLPGYSTLTRFSRIIPGVEGNGTLKNNYMFNSFFGHNKKIQSQRMLLENVPLPYSSIMSEYVDYLLQEDKLHLIKFLADGRFTEVYQGSYSESQSYGTSITHFVAVKRFKEPLDDETVFKYITQCLKLTAVDHANVLKIKGLSFGPQHKVLLVSPYLSQNNLMTYLRMLQIQKTPKKPDVDSVEHLVSIIQQISSGMEALSDIGFVYKMLSSETCLVDSEGNVMIGDLSYYWFVNQAYTIWNAPEVQSDNAEHTEKSDVWSFGVTALEVLNMGGLPVASTKLDGLESLQKPPMCPQLLYNLLERCLDKDPNQRPTFNIIVNEINELMNDESFRNQISTMSLTDDTNITTSLYGPHGYLKILPDNTVHIPPEQDYIYTAPVSSSSPISQTHPTSPAGHPISPKSPSAKLPKSSPPKSPASRPTSTPNHHISPLSKANRPISTSSAITSPPIINVNDHFEEEDSETEDGYVAVSPQHNTSPNTIEPPLSNLTPNSSPVPNFFERSDSEESENELTSHDYYNVHFKPAAHNSNGKKKSSKKRI